MATPLIVEDLDVIEQLRLGLTAVHVKTLRAAARDGRLPVTYDHQHSPLRSVRQNSTQPDGMKKPHIRTVGPATTSVHVVRRGCNLATRCVHVAGR